MADLDEMISSLKKMKTETIDINTSLVRINKAYGTSSIDSIAKLTGSSEKLGAAWSIVTRATEAFCLVFLRLFSHFVLLLS